MGDPKTKTGEDSNESHDVNDDVDDIETIESEVIPLRKTPR